METVLKRFDNPDETRQFEKGRFELVRVGGMTIGRATYEPGWKWSVHIGGETGAAADPVPPYMSIVWATSTLPPDSKMGQPLARATAPSRLSASTRL